MRPRRPARAAAFLAALLGVLAGAVPPAAAHVVYGRASLAGLVAAADVVARARITRRPTLMALGAAGERRPVVTAELLEILKGELAGPPSAAGAVTFAQHGHGVAAFAPGDEVLLFLQAIERSRELAPQAAGGPVRWVSLQEHEEKLALDDGSRGPLVAAVRAYAAAQAMVDPAAALAATRELTLRLLRSPERRLAESALRDLVTGGARLLTRESLPAVEPLIDDPALPIGIRLGLLAELERLGLIEAPPRWAALLARVEPPELLAVVRAAAAHPSAPVNRELVRLLAAPDPEIAEAAAIALGVPGNHEAVTPLARALAAGRRDLAMAAIRGLGRIGTTAAVAALEAAASGHDDATVRRRARAELRRPAASGPEGP